MYIQWIRDLFFPTRCPSCHRLVNVGSYWCEECFRDVCNPRCISLERSDLLHHVYALSKYEAGITYSMQQLKFHQQKGQAEALVPLLIQIPKLIDIDRVDLVVPIPISEKKRKERGWNQVDIIFKKYFQKTYPTLPYVDVLGKVNTTTPMWGLDKEARKINIQHAFYQIDDGPCIEGKRILLLDDILTTGSTLCEASRILYAGGASSVEALVLASGADKKID